MIGGVGGGGVQKGIKQLLTTQQAVHVSLYELLSIPDLCWKIGISRKGLGKKRELKKSEESRSQSTAG